MSYSYTDIKAMIDRRRKELAEFDELPIEEQRRRTLIGRNPHEPKEVRERKKAAELERRKKEFDKLPEREREIRTMLGWSPYQDGQIIHRTSGTIAVKK